MNKYHSFTPLTLVLALGLGGCASVGGMTDTQDSSAAAGTDGPCCARVAELENLLVEKEGELSEVQRASEAMTAAAPAAAGTGADMLLPPNAKAGECYARVLTPTQYRTEEKSVLKKQETERVEVIPAKYEMVEQQVLVKEASEEAVLIPAKYTYVTETITVTEASEKIVAKPATYETVTEKVLVKPAYTSWKKGRGPIEKIDNSTGEIMCLIEVPAEYKTVSKRVQVTPPTTEKVAIPGKTKEVKKRVMSEPPKMVKKTIPAEYKTVMVKKMVTPPQEKRIKIPAEYMTVTEQHKVSDASLEWRSILCETNTTPNVIRELQRALQTKGYNPGPIDGVVGWETMGAVKRFQADNKMASGQLTIETLKALGVL